MPNPQIIPISDAVARPHGTLLAISGRITQIRTRLTRHRNPWAQLTLADAGGELDVYVFPHYYATIAPELIVTGAPLTVTGHLNYPPDQDPHIHTQTLHRSVDTKRARVLTPGASANAARMADQLAALSEWIDATPGNTARSDEARLWGRVAKISEEGGEAIAALIGMTGQNPRKGITHTLDDLREELLDVAVTALAAVEHLDGNTGHSLDQLAAHLDRLTQRAGLPSRTVQGAAA